MKGFVGRNTLKLVIPLLIVTVADQIFKWCYYGVITYHFSDFIYKGETPLRYSWFIYALWVLYILFYLVAKSPLRKQRWSLILGLLLLNFLYILVLRRIGWGVYWNLSLLAFNTGTIIAAWEKGIKHLESLQPMLCIAGAIAIYGIMVAFNLRTIYQAIIPVGLYIFITYCGSTKDIISDFLGNHSFEIYLCHGMFVPMAYLIGLEWASALLFALTNCILFAIPVKWLSNIIVKPILSNSQYK